MIGLPTTPDCLALGCVTSHEPFCMGFRVETAGTQSVSHLFIDFDGELQR